MEEINDIHSRLNHQEAPWRHEHVVERHHDSLIAEALKARDSDAESHRATPFLVGSAVLAFDGHGKYKIFSAGNKTTRGSFTADGPYEEKPCAERRAIQKATAGGFREIVAIATVCDQTLPGEQIRIPRSDDEGGVETNILHPCDQCLKMFAEHVDNGTIISKKTAVINFNDAEAYTEVDDQGKKSLINAREEERTVEELLKLYSTKVGRGKVLDFATAKEELG